jgi:hypothetical protein
MRNGGDELGGELLLGQPLGFGERCGGAVRCARPPRASAHSRKGRPGPWHGAGRGAPGRGRPPEPPYLPDQQAAILSASAREDARWNRGKISSDRQIREQASRSAVHHDS